MHMGLLQVLQLEQVPVVQQVLAVHFADSGYCGVYCFAVVLLLSRCWCSGMRMFFF